MKNTILAAALVALLLGGCSPHTESEAPTAFVTASNVTLTAAQQQHIQFTTIAPSEFHRTVDTTGIVNFDSDQATTILAPMSGPVSRILVKLGEEVKEGQPLAEVDSPDFATAISTYVKALATARITQQLAQQDQDLIKHHGVSLREAEQAKIDATNAAADAEAALQQLVSLKVDTNAIKAIQNGKPIATVPGIIRSPIAGSVVDRAVTVGELLQGGTTPCFTVADLSKVWVMANLFGPDLGSVSAGDPAEVLTGTGLGDFSGTVENIAAVMDPDTRSVAVRVVVENPKGALKNQMYVRVLIHSKNGTTGMMSPVSAILRDDENLPFVYVAQADGSFARQSVTLGYRDGDRYDITEGLKTGDRIVADGALFVQFLQNQ
ncbi:MAG TPA: efflux RND transporter periplasmic adaptor subunit [Verrucomicrobiae bacterium]|jgi:cobalt-zinc-cadmium efflux system membrane fusion protein|nr:efflux RND transporter periplasmic adaptor subunit [Verrucomicrobiae bacterium]